MSIVAPMCLSCKHYDRTSDVYGCKAFDVIPEDIIESRADHRQPIEGDRGIQFEQDPERPEPDFSILDATNAAEPS